MEKIGERLKYFRELNGYTQYALDKATGISQQKLSYYEKGKHPLPIGICIKLADFYGISLDELVGREYSINKKQDKDIPDGM